MKSGAFGLKSSSRGVREPTITRVFSVFLKGVDLAGMPGSWFQLEFAFPNPTAIALLARRRYGSSTPSMPYTLGCIGREFFRGAFGREYRDEQ